MAKRKTAKPKRDNPEGGEEKYLGLSGKTWLILGGCAVGGLLLWKLYQARKAAAAPGAGASQPYPLPPGVTPIVPTAGMGAATPAAPCPATPQIAAADDVGPADEFGGGGELL